MEISWIINLLDDDCPHLRIREEFENFLSEFEFQTYDSKKFNGLEDEITEIRKGLTPDLESFLDDEEFGSIIYESLNDSDKKKDEILGLNLSTLNRELVNKVIGRVISDLE